MKYQVKVLHSSVPTDIRLLDVEADNKFAAGKKAFIEVFGSIWNESDINWEINFRESFRQWIYNRAKFNSVLTFKHARNLPFSIDAQIESL